MKYDLGDIPEINDPAVTLKMSKAIIMSLEKDSLLTQQQSKYCIEKINEIYSNEIKEGRV